MPTDETCRPPRFFYFDLGNVLLFFDHHRAARQMADVAGVTVERVWQLLFADSLELRYERGEITSREFYEAFCDATGTQPDFDALAHAAADIFEVNAPVKAIVTQLYAAGHRLGLLSNTCEIHWDHVSCGRYAPIPEIFETQVLSFRVAAVKPEPAVFHRAAEMAGVRPDEIFYVDDTAGHVAAARALGFDAVVYSTAAALADDLRRRGARFNY